MGSLTSVPVLADGSEYAGNDDVPHGTFAEFHLPKVAAIMDTGAGWLVFETILSLQGAKGFDSLLWDFPPGCLFKEKAARRDGTKLAECAWRFVSSEQMQVVSIVHPSIPKRS